LRVVVQRIAVAATAGVAAIALAISLAPSPTRADTAIGFDAGATVGNNSLDAGFEQTLQSDLDSQFAGVNVAVVGGRLVLEGYATPGVHTAVLALVANVLKNPVPVPGVVDVVSPNLGLDLPFLEAGAGLEIPDLGRLLRLLGVVDHIQIIR
jgi:hypothetical protein